VSCVVTRHFGALREGFHRIALGFHAHVAVTLQHATADVTSNRHDRGVRRTALRTLRDGAVPQIVEPEPRQARFLRQRSPCRPPALHVPRRIKASDVVVHYSLAAERELGYERSKQQREEGELRLAAWKEQSHEAFLPWRRG
jgi:hypothetical protein